MSTQSPPNTQSPRPPNTQSRANAATLRDLHHTCLGSGHSPSPVGRADCMCLHGRPCVWVPFAAACCYTLFYLLMMPAARLVCQRPSSNFPYFRTPLANFLLSRPNSVVNTVILKQLHCCPRLNVGYASTLPRSNWMQRASIRLAWYRHMPACYFLSILLFSYFGYYFNKRLLAYWNRF